MMDTIPIQKSKEERWREKIKCVQKVKLVVSMNKHSNVYEKIKATRRHKKKILWTKFSPLGT